MKTLSSLGGGTGIVMGSLGMIKQLVVDEARVVNRIRMLGTVTASNNPEEMGIKVNNVDDGAGDRIEDI